MVRPGPALCIVFVFVDNAKRHTVNETDVLSDDSDSVLGEQRVAAPEAGACDVTDVQSRLDHVINAVLCRRVNSSKLRRHQHSKLLCRNSKCTQRNRSRELYVQTLQSNTVIVVNLSENDGKAEKEMRPADGTCVVVFLFHRAVRGGVEPYSRIRIRSVADNDDDSRVTESQQWGCLRRP